MPGPEKDKKNTEVSVEDIVDAVIIEENETDPKFEDSDTDTPEAPIVADEPADEQLSLEEKVAEQSETDPELEATDIDQIDPIAEQEPTVEQLEPKASPAPAVEEPGPAVKGGFVPLVLGGIVAAGLGFGASRVILPDGWSGADGSTGLEELTVAVQNQATTIETLQQRLATVEAQPSAPSVDLAPVTTAIDQAQGTIAELDGRVSVLDARLSDLEKRPAEGGVSAGAIEAYEREVQALKDLMEKQKAEVDALVASAQQEKASAEMTAHQALIRSAVSRVQIALDTGNGFSEALSDLKAAGVSIPAPLLDAADEGVATLTQLAAEYPEAARKALAVARKAEGSSGDVWNFLRNQLGMRSLQPKEGADADAILSRAEAALADGRLTDAMAELQGLPEEGRVELTDWMARATRRAQAVAAAEDLSAQVASN